MEWYFIFDGDPQIGLEKDNNGYPKIRANKENIGEKLNKYSNDNNIKIDFVICAGDLTQGGKDAKKILFYKNGEYNELGIFIDKYYNNIKNNGYNVYCCPGNHDTYVSFPYFWKPVFKFLKDKYDATYGLGIFTNWKNYGYYKFEHNGVLFMSLGVYPYNLSWIRKNLPKDNTKPIIIFYHYNTIIGEPYSDWWSNEEKNNFYNIIKEFNILMIINGHLHSSQKDIWNGIPIVKGSGKELGLVKIKDNKISEIKFI